MNNIQRDRVTCYMDGIQLLRSFGEGQLHPAFGVMRPEELIFILANSARRGIREPSVVDSIPKHRENDLPPQPFSIPASRTLDDWCCS